MPTSRVLIPALAFALTGMVAHAQPASSVEPIISAGVTQKLTPHVYAIEDKDSVPGVPNIGMVVGSRAALIIDTGMGPRNGQIVLAETEKVAPGRALYLVTTHVHPEHDLGAQAFPDSTKMIRSQDQEKDIAEFGYQTAQIFINRSAINAELLKGAKFRKADIHFDQEYDLDLGGVRVRILAMGANHTRGDTAVFVPSEKVLFAGDIAMRAQPAFASPYSNLAHWIASLDRFATLQPKIVVPSHGPIGDASYITNYRMYLTTVRDRTIRLKQQGHTVDQVIATLTPEMKERYPDAGRLAGAIRAAYAEGR